MRQNVVYRPKNRSILLGYFYDDERIVFISPKEAVVIDGQDRVIELDWVHWRRGKMSDWIKPTTEALPGLVRVCPRDAARIKEEGIQLPFKTRISRTVW